MGSGITEVMAAVKAQGIGPAGLWFTHHRKMDPATFDFEICCLSLHQSLPSAG